MLRNFKKFFLKISKLDDRNYKKYFDEGYGEMGDESKEVTNNRENDQKFCWTF